MSENNQRENPREKNIHRPCALKNLSPRLVTQSQLHSVCFICCCTYLPDKIPKKSQIRTKVICSKPNRIALSSSRFQSKLVSISNHYHFYVCFIQVKGFLLAIRSLPVKKTLRYRVTWIFWIAFWGRLDELVAWLSRKTISTRDHKSANGSKSTSPGRQVKATDAFSKSIRWHLRWDTLPT